MDGSLPLGVHPHGAPIAQRLLLHVGATTRSRARRIADEVQRNKTSMLQLLPPEVLLHVVELGEWAVARVLVGVCRYARTAVREWQRTLDAVHLQYHDDGSELLRVLVLAAPHTTSLTKLVVTNFAWCARIDESILQIVRHSPGLRYLDLSYNDVGDEALMSITTMCVELEHIDVSWCCSVTDDSLMAIALQCPKLRHLDVSRCAVTDAGVAEVTTACRELRFLGLGFCDGVKIIECLGACVHLEHLDLRDCKAIAHVPADKWPNLQYLNLTRCTVNDAVVAAIAHSCPRLEHVNLSRCAWVSDRSIVAIASSCAQLQTLCVHECQHVTDVGVVALAAKCLNLRRLGALECYSISDAAFAQLQRQRPNARIQC